MGNPLSKPKGTQGFDGTPTLHYLKVRARGEPLRMMFAYKNQELNNQEYTSDSDSWPAAKQKHSFKQDQLPVLELSDGTKISQSTVIARFAGNRLGLVPESDVKAAEVDEVVEFVQEIFQAANLVVNGLADEDKAKDFKEAKWPTYAGYFAEYLNGKNFLAGEEPTYADFIMWHVVDVAKTVIPGTLDDKKALKEFHERVASLPGVKDYLANRRAV